MKNILKYLSILLLGIAIGGLIVTKVSVYPLDPDVGTSADGHFIHMMLYSIITLIISITIFIIQLFIPSPRN